MERLVSRGDAERRELERTVAAGGGAGARLRLAAALERVGERSRALEVLLPELRDPEVRKAIARLPAWTESLGTGNTRFADVRPLRRTPRVRWVRETVEDDPALPETDMGALLGERGFMDDVLFALPFGIVVRPLYRLLAVLSPDTGATRWLLDPLHPARPWEPGVAGEHVLQPYNSDKPSFDASPLARLDLWTGTQVDELKIPGLLVASPSAGFLLSWNRDDRLEGHEVEVGNERVPAWRVPAPREMWRRPWKLVATRERIVQWYFGRSLIVIDRASGEVLWTVEGHSPCVDERGIVFGIPGGGFELRRWDGSVVFRHKARDASLALLPEAVIASWTLGPAALYPRTGGEAMLLEGDGQVLAAAQGVIYRGASWSLDAVDSQSGKLIWSAPVTCPAQRAAVFPGGVVIIDSDRRLVCFEETPSG